jgi:polar amino acid transport system substrate-binding protein
VPDAATGRAALEAQLADALALSMPSVRALAAGRPGLLALPLQPDPGQPQVVGIGHVGFAFRPGDAALRQAWLQAQAQVQGHTQHLDLLQRHGFSADDLPQGVRLADLLPA